MLVQLIGDGGYTRDFALERATLGVGGEVSGEVYVCHEAPNPIR